MRLIFNLFLGWWLTRHRWMAEGQPYPPPSISVNPSNVVAVGQNINIGCKKEGNVKRTFVFCLYKGNAEINHGATDHNEFEFHITNARESHQGQYSCIYKSDSMWSHFSQTVFIYVRDLSLTKPSIQIINAEQDAPEANISIRCEGTEPNLIFALLKSRQQIDYKAAKLGGKAVNFSLHWMTLEEAQNYTCQYHRKSSPFVWSVPSDPLERPWKAATLITLWTSTAAFLFLLAVLLLVLTLILYRKRRKDAVTKESNVPPKMFLNSPIEETPDEVSYAAINHNSLKIRPTTLYDTAPESCIYATVSKGSIKETQ